MVLRFISQHNCVRITVDGEVIGGRMLRYSLWAAAAVLIVLIATDAGVGRRGAGASEGPYDSEELRFSATRQRVP